MDLATLAVSAGVSALVGTLFSVLTVSRLTVGRMRAEKAELARQAVRDAIRPTMLEVDLYKRNLRSSLGRDDRAYPEDAVTASAVLKAAEGLRWYRRRLVHRRAKRVFGREFVNLAALYEGDEERITLGALFAPLLVVGHQKARTGERVTFVDGLLHQGLQAAPESRATAMLVRQLRRLAACW